MSHLDEGQLHALLDGEIPSAELPPVQAHLASCATCRARLEEARQLLADADGMVGVLEVPAGIAAAPRRVAPVSSPKRWSRGLAWAASLIGAIGLGYALRGSGPLPAEKETLAAAPVPVPVPASLPAEATAKAAPNPPQQPRPDARAALAQDKSRSVIASQGAGVVETSKPPASAPAEYKAIREPAVTRPVDSNRTPTRPQPAPAAAASAAQGFAGLRDRTTRLEEVIVTGALESNAAKTASAPAEPISLPDALRRLGGSIRLLDGWVPLRLEAQGPYVRVVYPIAQGELVLSQQLIDGRVVFTLIAPPGFPSDSLARLRARVRE